MQCYIEITATPCYLSSSLYNVFPVKYIIVRLCRGQGNAIRVEIASEGSTENKTPPSSMKLAIVLIKFYFIPDNINSFSNDNKL